MMDVKIGKIGEIRLEGGRAGGRTRRSGNKRGVSRPRINKDKREEKSNSSEREKVRKKGKTAGRKC